MAQSKDDKNLDFTLQSLNVRGMRDYKKSKKVFNWLNKHGAKKGIAFVQESHSSPDIEQKWAKQYQGELITSHGSANSRGVAILFGEQLEYKIESKLIDQNGRFLIVLCKIQGSNFILVNSYAPNEEKDQVLLFKDIFNRISEIELPIDTSIIWGGDFNFIFDVEMEASGGNPNPKLKSIETMLAIMFDLDLCDIWRVRHPNLKRFTWRGSAQGKKSKRGSTL